MVEILIPLSSGYSTKIDAEDAERVNRYKWSASEGSRLGQKVYALRRERKNGQVVAIRLHRFIMGLPPGKLDPENRVVDHINGNPLDNRKENLRVTTQAGNMENAAGWVKRKTPTTVEPSL